jgi:hypothetical protein
LRRCPLLLVCEYAAWLRAGERGRCTPSSSLLARLGVRLRGGVMVWRVDCERTELRVRRGKGKRETRKSSEMGRLERGLGLGLRLGEVFATVMMGLRVLVRSMAEGEVGGV